MYTKAKQRLFDILSSCDNHSAAIFGDELYYEQNGELTTDAMIGWDSFFNDIMLDKDFKTECYNMQLIITLN